MKGRKDGNTGECMDRSTVVLACRLCRIMIMFCSKRKCVIYVHTDVHMSKRHMSTARDLLVHFLHKLSQMKKNKDAYLEILELFHFAGSWYLRAQKYRCSLGRLMNELDQRLLWYWVGEFTKWKIKSSRETGRCELCNKCSDQNWNSLNFTLDLWTQRESF